ncbi:MAG TPA: beta-propeller domain-containing protein, partial [Micromonosporaceae bacterium]|nr:beta-propeller domain-containing protein [Micromonosporaceae bacterium]
MTAVLAFLLVLPGCTADSGRPPAPRPPGAGAPAFRLVAFDSCADALAGLKAAAKGAVGPWGLGVGAMRAFAAAEGGPVSDRAAVQLGPAVGRRAEAPAFSGTNSHESAVDEPDLVKTDGRRIVTVSRGVLRVVDPASRRVTGQVELAAPDSPARYAEMSLLMHGDRALVLVS